MLRMGQGVTKRHCFHDSSEQQLAVQTECGRSPTVSAQCVNQRTPARAVNARNSGHQPAAIPEATAHLGAIPHVAWWSGVTIPPHHDVKSCRGHMG